MCGCYAVYSQSNSVWGADPNPNEIKYFNVKDVYSEVFLFIIIAFGFSLGVSDLITNFRLSSIKKLVSDQVSTQEETNKHLLEVIKLLNPAKDEPSIEDQEMKTLLLYLSHFIKEDLLVKLAPHKLHRIKKHLENIKEGDVLALHDNTVKIIEKERYQKMKQEGIADQYDVIYERNG
jgi:hypothetical protein